MLKKLIPFFVGAAFTLAGVLISPDAGADTHTDPVIFQRVSQFSGKIVPRFESLRASDVNGRVGPSLDHPIRWHYQRAGLPMMVIMETRDWSKVRDPDGAEVWVYNQLLSSRATAITRTESVLKKKPTTTSAASARLAAGVVVEVLNCNEAWCRVSAEGRKGWLSRVDIWGNTKIDPNA